MKALVFSVISGLSLQCLAMPLHAADQANLDKEARAHVMTFSTQLKAALMAGMQAQGPEHAIEVCNVQAPAIAKTVSQQGWEVARTSLKIRNPANAPDAWEKAMLDAFESRMQAGEDPANIEASEIVAGEYRYMKAIPTAEMCLACHGSQLSPAVSARLEALYPEDKARGFAVNDLRGAFTLRKRAD